MQCNTALYAFLFLYKVQILIDAAAGLLEFLSVRPEFL